MLATGRWQTDPDPRHRFRDKGRGRPPGEIGDSPKACPWRRGPAAPSPEPGPIPIALSTGRQEPGGAPCSARDTPTMRSAPWSSGSPVRRGAWAGRARRIASQVLRRSRRGGTAPGPRVDVPCRSPRGARDRPAREATPNAGRASPAPRRPGRSSPASSASAGVRTACAAAGTTCARNSLSAGRPAPPTDVGGRRRGRAGPTRLPEASRKPRVVGSGRDPSGHSRGLRIRAPTATRAHLWRFRALLR